jgi:hypothetical protein
MRRVIFATVLPIAFLSGLVSCDSSVKGNEVAEVKMLRSDRVVGMTVNATDWTDIPGATTTIEVPGGENAIVLTRWGAVSNNQPGSELGAIRYRVLVGSAVASPGGPGSGSFFVSVPAYVERSSQVLTSGVYSVKMQASAEQFAGPGDTASVNLSHFHFTVERIRA